MSTLSVGSRIALFCFTSGLAERCLLLCCLCFLAKGSWLVSAWRWHLTIRPSGRAYRAPLNSSVRHCSMSSRWHFNLAQALLEAGLDPALASHAEPTESFCNSVAQLVSRAYLQGQVSWGAADAVVNHLHFFILGCSTIPKYAWGVYEAF